MANDSTSPDPVAMSCAMSLKNAYGEDAAMEYVWQEINSAYEEEDIDFWWEVWHLI
jgi:hypothetical protein